MEAKTLGYSAKSARTSMIYETIKAKIMSHEIKPDAQLVEEILAEEFEVSRTPIREALKKLEKDGFVEIVKNKGAFVKRMSIQDVVEIFTIREALEGISARISAQLINDANLAMLEEHLKMAQELQEKGEIERAFHLGNELHDVILKIAGNERINQIVTNLKEHTYHLNNLSLSLPGRLKQSNVEHLEILEALKKHDGELAENYIRKHIKSTKNDVVIWLRNTID